MSIGDLADDGEAETGAVRPRGEEGLGGAGERGGVHAPAGVANGDLHAVADQARAERQHAALGHGLHGIQHEVQERLAQPLAVAVHPGLRRLHARAQPHAGRARGDADELGCLVNEADHVDGEELDGRAPAHGEKILGHGVQLLHPGDEPRRHRRQIRRVGTLIGEEHHREIDPVQHVANLVGHLGRHRAQRGQGQRPVHVLSSRVPLIGGRFSKGCSTVHPVDLVSGGTFRGGSQCRCRATFVPPENPSPAAHVRPALALT
jgi:hypothetical protein